VTHIAKPDLGPRALLHRGERIQETAPDISRPNASVTRARRYCAVRAMAAAAPDSQRDAWRARLDAAEAYARACEIVHGARDGKPDSVPEVRVSSSPRGVPDVALEAASLVRDAVQAMGMTGTQVVNMLVLRAGTLSDVARVVGCGQSAAAGYVLATLDKLAEVV
jgi:hypothetical protein